MKKFFIHTILLLGITFISMIVLDYLYDSVFHTNNPRNKIQYVTQLKNKHIDYLFFGSSRAENHIDCELFEEITGKSCLNLGLQGGRLQDVAVLLEILQNNNVTYTKSVVQVDYLYNFEGYSVPFRGYINPYIHDDIVPKELVDEEEFKGVKVPFYRFMSQDKICGFREIVTQSISKKPSVNLENGFVPVYGVGHNIAGSFPKSIKASNKAIDKLESISSGSVIYFTAPYCKNANNRDTFVKELSNRIPDFLNYVNLFDLEEVLFSNCGHLNIDGAKKFTRIIASDLIK